MNKSAISEAERLELAAKLDRELDEFIENLPKREKQTPVAFDRWEEEVANHPFFMKEAPEPGSELHPLYEGLQKLKYDPDENEPEELANAYKDDGNFHFKHKKYRMAIISYTEGLKAKSGNCELDANLYNNRSAAHFFLKNYRSALADAEAALKLQPEYNKVTARAALCCYHMEKYQEAIEFCDKIGDMTLRQKCVNAAKVKERNRRKRELESRKLQKEEEEILTELKKRQIRIDGASQNLTLSKLEPQFPQLFDSRVKVNQHGRLVWPVILFYPEYKIMDYIQEFDEADTFYEQLCQVFADFPEWDLQKQYQPNSVNVYYENDRRRNVKIDLNRTLLEVLQNNDLLVKEGTPKFVILVAGSRVEQLFLQQV